MSVILLYVLDSLRADATEPYGGPNNSTPELKKLANEGVTFNNAYSQSTWTRPSGTSILSSTYPSLHGVNTVDEYYPPKLPSMAEELQEAGYTTIGITAMGNISPTFGFDKGFDEFRTLYDREGIINREVTTETKDVGWEDMFESDSVGIATGADINEEVEDILEIYGGDDIFLFIWSLDTHDPYYHRDPSIAKYADVTNDEPIWNYQLKNMNNQEGRKRLCNLYQDMVYYADKKIGNLVCLLQSMGLYDDSLLVITGDHGEAFGEHGKLGHRGKPYEEQIHVPLIVKPSEETNTLIENRTTDKIVELIDLYPTICKEANITVQSQYIQGDNLFNNSVKDRAFIEVLGDREGYRALRTKDMKYIQVVPPEIKIEWIKGTIARSLAWAKTAVTKDEVYDLTVDSNESSNRIGELNTLELIEYIQNQVVENNKMAGNIDYSKDPNTDEKTKSQLEYLGYLE